MYVTTFMYILYAGFGYKVLACLNILFMSKNLLKQHEREIGSALEKITKESFKKAAKEGRMLIIQC